VYPSFYFAVITIWILYNFLERIITYTVAK